MRHLRTALAGIACAAMVAGSAPAADLVIWWSKGVTEKEDQLLRDAVAAWESKTGKTAEISFLGTGDVSKKTVAAVQAGEPPDLAFAFNFDLSNSPVWAYEGKLADMSDVLEPIKDQFQDSALRSVTMLNGETGEFGYYAVPWSQMTMMIHYWEDMLTEAGYTDADIPQDWEGFFGFWCNDFQPGIRKAGKRMRGLGQSASTASNDAYFNIHTWLKAYGVDPLDEDGKLTLKDPEVRKRTIQAIEAYAKPIVDGCSPPDSSTWKGAEDNTAFLNKQYELIMNATLSIPISQLESNPDAYYKLIRTVPWPRDMAGNPMTTLVSVKQIVTFKNSPHLDNAKDFLRYLLQPEVIGGILKEGGGRFTPVMPALLNDPFFSATDDPHRSAMYKTFTEGATKPYPHSYNWKYGRVMSEGVWQNGIGRIVADGWSAEDAVDQIISEISDILGEDS